MLVSPSTGIILNNEMDDFSLPDVNSYYGVPPSEANFIMPGKIPQSSMSPSVILDRDDNVRLVIGASGGTRITSSAGLVSTQFRRIRSLCFLRRVIYKRRFFLSGDPVPPLPRHRLG